ncbi:MAG: BrnT family toxin [Alteraurantiacibacter sp.]
MSTTAASGFQWDSGNRAKCQKHGLTIALIEALFTHPHHLAPDAAHSTTETRLLAIGRGGGARPILAAFTLREVEGELFIRPISARYMHSKEIEAYEQAFAPSHQ